MPLRLVIFDLDGTLVDSLPDITAAVNHAVAPLGIAPRPLAEIGERVGGGMTNLLGGILGKERGHLLEETVQTFFRYYLDHPADRTRLYPGVAEVLAGMAGMRKGVISNKREILARAVLEALGMAGHFELIYGSDSASEKKPSPRPILQMLDALVVPPGEAAIIGDSEMDIRAGKGAGIGTIGVTWGYRSREALDGADVIIDAMTELPAVIGRLQGA